MDGRALSPAPRTRSEGNGTVPVLIVVKDGLISPSQGIHWGSSGYWPAASSMMPLPVSTLSPRRTSNDKAHGHKNESSTGLKKYSEASLRGRKQSSEYTTTTTTTPRKAVTVKTSSFSLSPGTSIPTAQSMKINDHYDEFDLDDSSRKDSTDSKVYGFFDESFKALCEEHIRMETGTRYSICESLEVDYPLDFDDDDDSDYEFEVEDDSSDDEEVLTPLTPRPNPSKRCSDPQVQLVPASTEGEISGIEETLTAQDPQSIMTPSQRPALERKNPSDFLTPQNSTSERGQQVIGSPSTRASSISGFVPVNSGGVSIAGSLVGTPDISQSESDASNLRVSVDDSHIVLHLCPEHNVLSSSRRPCLCLSTLEMYELGKIDDNNSSTHRIARVFSSLRHKKDSLSVDKTLQMKLKKASRLRKLSRKPSQSPFAELSHAVRSESPSSTIREDDDVSVNVPEVDASLDAFAEWLSNPHPFEGNSLRGVRSAEHDPNGSPNVSQDSESIGSAPSYFREDTASVCSFSNMKALSAKLALPEFIPDEATNHLSDWDLFLHIHKFVSIKDKKIRSLVGEGQKGFADVPLEYIDHKGLPAIMASKAPMAYFLTHLLQSQHHQWLVFLWEFVSLEENIGTIRLKQMARMYELYLNPEGYLFLGWDVLASEENFTSVNPSRLLLQLKDRAWKILAREFDVWWGQEHPLMRRMFKTIGLTTTRVDVLKLREAFSYPLHTITATFNDLLSQHQGALGPDIVFEDSPRGKLVRHHSAIRTLQRKFCETVMGVDNQFFNIKIGDYKELGAVAGPSPNSSSSSVVL